MPIKQTVCQRSSFSRITHMYLFPLDRLKLNSIWSLYRSKGNYLFGQMIKMTKNLRLLTIAQTRCVVTCQLR